MKLFELSFTLASIQPQNCDQLEVPSLADINEGVRVEEWMCQFYASRRLDCVQLKEEEETGCFARQRWCAKTVRVGGWVEWKVGGRGAADEAVRTSS
ncbi:MAG: hypothetical protein ACKERG_00990 [Candidatus Hodgkinia cicadicola]